MSLFINMSLKNKLFLAIGISAFMIFSLQIYYYYKFYGLTETRESEHISTVVQQVEERVHSFAQDIKDAAAAFSYNTVTGQYLLSDDPIYRLSLHKTVIEIVSGIKSANKNIQSILLVDRKGRVTGASSVTDYSILNEIYKKYHIDSSNPSTPLFGKVFVQEEMSRDAYVYIQPIFSTHDMSIVGNCVIIYKTAGLNPVVMNVRTSANGLLTILDEDNKVISADRVGLTGTLLDAELASRLSEGQHEFKMDYVGRMNQVLAKEIAVSGWKVVSLTPVEEMITGLRPIQKEIFFIGIAITLVIFGMSIIMIRSATIPFTRLLRFLDSVGEEGERRRIHYSARNEMGVLATEINKMLDKIDSTNEQYLQAATSLYQMEIAQKQTELLALQSQINPHFLYNTLECIRSIGLSYRASEVVEIASSMAKIFRYSIKEDSFVLIHNELESVRDYLHIMSIRYMDKFEVRIQVTDPILQLRIPKMILQPIVENAIYHGLERKKGPGKLTIDGMETEDGDVCFEIIDNGAGIGYEQLKQIRRLLQQGAETQLEAEVGSGIGLLNIQRRIRLAFGKPYGIEIDSKEKQGTVVHVKIPKQVP